MPTTLHIANKNYSSWSLRPWLLLRVLELPFDERVHPLGGDYSLSPTRRLPLLEDGSIAIWDSLAITEHLAERHPQVWPADRAARAWARAAAAEMHAGFNALRNECSMTCGQRLILHTLTPALQADLDRLDALWEQGLQRFGGPYLAGAAFTAVDAFYAPVAFRIQTYALPLGQAALAYAARLRALPAMQQWYAEALAEPWRDLAHEAEILAHGRVTADLRAPTG